MRLTALVDRVDHVCCRYRLAAFRDLLARQGHVLDFRSWPKRWWNWFHLRHDLEGTDAVIFQRRLLQRWQLYLLRRSCPRLIFDFDDAIFLRDSFAPRGLHSPLRLRKFAATVGIVDAVVAGNAFLAEEASRCAPHTLVRIIPTCVDPWRYPSAAGKSGQPGHVQLVWVGSSSTLQGLEVITPLLEDLGKSVPGLKLKMVCDRFLSLQHLPVEPCSWKIDTEAREIAAGDIGISWIPDDLWSRGKCGLKVLQYMAAGLPVVTNPVGVHPEMVWHDKTGYLACTPAEWVKAVRSLASDPVLRSRMGQTARARVERDYSLQAGAAGWISLLEEISAPVRRAG